MIIVSKVLNVVGIILFIIGILGGVYIYSISKSILSALAFSPIYLIGAVLLHAFAELLDSVNAIRKKLVGDSIQEDKPIPDSINKRS